MVESSSQNQNNNINNQSDHLLSSQEGGGAAVNNYATLQSDLKITTVSFNARGDHFVIGTTQGFSIYQVDGF